MAIFNPFARAVRLREGLPVLPGAFPLAGHLPALLRFPEVIRAAQEQVGPVYWVELGLGKRILVCTGPEALEIFRSKAFTSQHLTEISPLVAGTSMLSQDGAAHRHMRAAMSAPFLPRGLSASEIGATMGGLLGARVARWAATGRVKVLPEVQEMALEIIFRLLGVSLADLPAWRDRYRALLLANLGIDVDFPGSPARRAARARAWIDARFRDLVAAARVRPDAEGLLAELARGRDEEGRGLSEGELLDNLRLLVLGGHETISATMSWMLITLAARPALWEALSAEARDALVPTTPEAARAFPFAEALFRETVRLYPPFTLITRFVAEASTLHGKTIPRGALVAVDLWSLGRDPATFAAPDEYRPERWLGRDRTPTGIEVAQFGAGPHFCLGYHLAWLEAVQFAVALVRALGRAGKRPRLRTSMPEPVYVPTQRPPAKTVVELV
jgi:cytochrome P450